MLSLDLISKLRDAGFPLKTSLSELIKECGDNFEYLSNNVGNHTYTAAKSEEFIYCEGETPEEAVANLWLNTNNPGKT